MTGEFTTDPLLAQVSADTAPQHEAELQLFGRQAIQIAAAGWTQLVEPGHQLAGQLRARYGLVRSWEAVTTWPTATIAVPSGLSKRAVAQQLAIWRRKLPGIDPQQALRHGRERGLRLLTAHDDEWPEHLHAAEPGSPVALWVKGTGRLNEICRRSVAFVGARSATQYGKDVATQWSYELASAGVGIISGGAFGIDAAAHQGALAAGLRHHGPGHTAGSTVAVLACGADEVYPRSHDTLLTKIAEHGCVVSPYPPGSRPTRHQFLRRNAVLAALSSAVVVVEAALRSGAHSTANHAAALHRPLGAVPGPVTSAVSAGCHHLIRDAGAQLVHTPAAVLELIGCGVANDIVPERPRDRLSSVARTVLDQLDAGSSRSADEVSRLTGFTIRAVLGALGELEVADLAVSTGYGPGGAQWTITGGRR